MIDPVLREFPELSTDGVRVLVNPTGRFEIGGPEGRHGPHRVARSSSTRTAVWRRTAAARSAAKTRRRSTASAAYMARYVAKNVVAAGLAERCQLQVAYAIGTAHPVSLMIETFGTATVDPEQCRRPCGTIFDFRPAAIIRDLDLSRPIYGETAAYGHFGRKEFPWEATDRVDALRSAVGAEVLAGPVAVCIDRPLLALDKPFTYDLPADLEAGVGSYVRFRFHGKLTKGWILGATDDLPARTLPVMRAVSPDPLLRRRPARACPVDLDAVRHAAGGGARRTVAPAGRLGRGEAASDHRTVRCCRRPRRRRDDLARLRRRPATRRGDRVRRPGFVRRSAGA